MYKFFLYYFGDLDDKREFGKIKYDLFEVLFISFISTLCGEDSFSGMSHFGSLQEDWFRKYLKLENGIPSHDTFRTVLNMLDPKDFSNRFVKLMKDLMKASKKTKIRDHLAIDGKSIKGSRYLDKESNKHKIIHTVNVLSTNYGLSVCQRSVDGDKYTSETTAILEILNMLDLKKKVISVDAGMSYKAIGEKVIEKRGNYIFAIKDNNKKTFELIKEHVRLRGFIKDEKFMYEESEKAHGRETKRVFYSYNIPKKLSESISFPKIKYIGVYETYNILKNELSDRRYFITSKKINSPEEFYRLCRNHWQVENNLHWVLDVLYNEDSSTIKKGNAPKIILILRQLAVNLIKMEKSNLSLANKKRSFIWNQKYRDKILREYVKKWAI